MRPWAGSLHVRLGEIGDEATINQRLGAAVIDSGGIVDIAMSDPCGAQPGGMEP